MRTNLRAGNQQQNLKAAYLQNWNTYHLMRERTDAPHNIWSIQINLMTIPLEKRT